MNATEKKKESCFPTNVENKSSPDNGATWRRVGTYLTFIARAAISFDGSKVNTNTNNSIFMGKSCEKIWWG